MYKNTISPKDIVKKDFSSVVSNFKIFKIFQHSLLFMHFVAKAGKISDLLIVAFYKKAYHYAGGEENLTFLSNYLVPKEMEDCFDVPYSEECIKIMVKMKFPYQWILRNDHNIKIMIELANEKSDPSIQDTLMKSLFDVYDLSKTNMTHFMKYLNDNLCTTLCPVVEIDLILPHMTEKLLQRGCTIFTQRTSSFVLLIGYVLFDDIQNWLNSLDQCTISIFQYWICPYGPSMRFTLSFDKNVFDISCFKLLNQDAFFASEFFKASIPYFTIAYRYHEDQVKRIENNAFSESLLNDVVVHVYGNDSAYRNVFAEYPKVLFLSEKDDDKKHFFNIHPHELHSNKKRKRKQKAEVDENVLECSICLLPLSSKQEYLAAETCGHVICNSCFLQNEQVAHNPFDKKCLMCGVKSTYRQIYFSATNKQ